MTKLSHLLVLLVSILHSVCDIVNAHGTPYLRQEHHEEEKVSSVQSLFSTSMISETGKIDEEHIEEGILWSSDLFQGDLVMSKTQLSHFFGQEAANEIEAAGLLDRSNEIIKNRIQTNTPTPTSNNSNDDDDNGRRLGIITNYDYLWKTRDADNIVVVPYEIQTSMTTTEKTKVTDAMNHITTKTGVIRFVARTAEPDWVYFQNTDSGCYSYVGRITGQQAINVASTCSFGATVHEIYHALGFQHEQSRSDRDNFVTINWANIRSGLEYNFYKETTNSLGSPYDYGSIMHYGANYFGIQLPKCTPTAVKTDTVTRIKFQKTTVDSNTAYCVNVVNGNVALSEGQTVNFRPCGENNYANQDWIAESFGTGYNVIRFALDPTYCLTVNYVNSVKDAAPLVLKKCIGSTFDDQYFTMEQSSWTDVSFRWGTDTGYAITRDKTLGVASTYPIFLKTNGFDGYADQDFTVEFVTKTTGRSATVNTFCVYQTQQTINAYGNSIGQRSELSVEDIRQLQYLYKCPSGPRNVDVFCSTDCKCKENQGKCISDNQCEPGLYCSYDGVSMNRCYPITSPTAPTTLEPTLSPSKSPSKTPTSRPTTKPTKDPTFKPTGAPITKAPTKDPTLKPTGTPVTKAPSKNPTTQSPTNKPSTSVPTLKPLTTTPTKNPISAPTSNPVIVPTANPTTKPTEGPSENPTRNPTTKSPSVSPTKKPSTTPTIKPTTTTTSKPSITPTTATPTNKPVIVSAPTNNPTTSNPTTNPTKTPSNNPTRNPTTKSPSVSPTKKPVTQSTTSPTQKPVETTTPTKNPITNAPTPNPTISPISNPTTSPQSNACNYPKKKQCVKDTKCTWGKVGKKSKCMEFSCSVYVDETTCKLDTRCKWKSAKLTCINK